MSYPLSVLEGELQEQRAAVAGAAALRQLLPRRRDADRLLFSLTPTGPSRFFRAISAQNPPAEPLRGDLGPNPILPRMVYWEV